jgi:hypothetical protein
LFFHFRILFILSILSRKMFGQDEQDLQDEIFRKLPLAIGPAFAFVFQTLGAEVQQQADLNAGRRQVIHQLDFMGRSENLE